MTFLDALKSKLHADYSEGEIFGTKDFAELARKMRINRSLINDSLKTLVERGIVERVGDKKPLQMRVVKDKVDALLVKKHDQKQIARMADESRREAAYRLDVVLDTITRARVGA
ncbi:MAG TPA: hypothetical protein VGD14_02880 [bacterium]